MRKRLALALLATIVAAGIAVVVEPRIAGGQTTATVTLPGPAFVGREYSVHNRQGSSVCAAFVCR